MRTLNVIIVLPSAIDPSINQATVSTQLNLRRYWWNSKGDPGLGDGPIFYRSALLQPFEREIVVVLLSRLNWR